MFSGGIEKTAGSNGLREFLTKFIVPSKSWLVLAYFNKNLKENEAMQIWIILTMKTGTGCFLSPKIQYEIVGQKYLWK